MNIVIGVGRVLRDIKLYTTSNGKQVANIEVSVNKGKDKDGNYQSDILTFQIWEQTAKYSSEYVHKGDIVSVQGKVSVRKDQDKDGNNRYITYLVGNQVQKLANNQAKNGASNTNTQKANTSFKTEDITLDDGDYPWN